MKNKLLQPLVVVNGVASGVSVCLVSWWQVREGIGVLCSAIGDPARALEFFEQVLPEAESSRHIILNQIAACQTRLGNHTLAVASYKAALALRPNYLRAWVRESLFPVLLACDERVESCAPGFCWLLCTFVPGSSRE